MKPRLVKLGKTTWVCKGPHPTEEYVVVHYIGDSPALAYAGWKATLVRSLVDRQLSWLR